MPNKGKILGRDSCECGRARTVKRWGEWQCARCASILPQDYHTVEGGGRAYYKWRDRPRLERYEYAVDIIPDNVGRMTQAKKLHD